MAENLYGPYLKLRRADEHIVNLNPLLERYINGHGYEAVPDLKRKPGYVVWIARGNDMFPHDVFSTIIGDIVHNLHGALDLAISVCLRNAKKRDSLYFPVRDTYKKFWEAIYERPKTPGGKPKPRFPERMMNVLETRIQPYSGGYNERLVGLHKLSNMDKHRLIVPTVFGVEVVAAQTNLVVGVPILVSDVPLPIKNGCVLTEWKIGEGPPQAKIDQNASVTLSIVFNEKCGMGRAVNISDGVYLLFSSVENALKELEACL
jgi:hypothetical protein